MEDDVDGARTRLDLVDLNLNLNLVDVESFSSSLHTKISSFSLTLVDLSLRHVAEISGS